MKVFEMACLRKFGGVSRRDGIRNTKIQNRLNWQKDINRQIHQIRSKYFGHIARMNTQRYPYVALYGMCDEKGGRADKRKKWIDTIKEDRKEMHLKLYDDIQTTQDRELWRKSVEELPTRVDTTSPRSPRH